MDATHFEGMHRAFHAFREENDKAKPDREVLARLEADILQHEDAERKVAATGKRRHVDVAALLGPSSAEQKTSYFTWLRFGAGRDAGSLDWEKKWAAARRRTGLKLEHKALTKSDDTAGGFLAPPEFVGELIRAVSLFSPMRDLVRVRTTVAQELDAPKRTSAGAAVWTSEIGSRSETTNPGFGMVRIPVHEMTAETYVSFSMLEDAGLDLEVELQEEFSEQFALTEGVAVVKGNGIGKPMGFTDSSQGVASTNSGGVNSVADANGQADGIIDLQHSVAEAYARNGTWVLKRKTLGSVRKLKDAQKQYLWQPSPAPGMPSTILGSPYAEVPDMDDEGAGKFPMAFGDWRRAYTMADRITLVIVRDPFTQASAGQVKFLARRRVGGQVVLAEAIRLLRCA